MNRFNNVKCKDKKRIDHQGQIIQRKNDEIEALKSKISLLEAECARKDEIINSVEPLRKELSETVEGLRAKRDEYDALIAEMMQMRKIFNEELFGRKWWLTKHLIARK